MLCEWVELKGTPWRDRLQNWFQNSGCDVLVLTAYEIAPVDYTLLRASESAALYGPSTAESLSDQISYFEESRVEKIHGGLITLHRRTIQPNSGRPSRNCFVVEQMEEAPSGPIGDLLLDRFRAEDVLACEKDSRLLAARPRLSRDVVLVQEAVQENRSWKPRIIYLERRAGLPRRLGFSAEIAELVGCWDGSQDLDFLITDYARQKSLPKKQIISEWLRLARRLASLGLVAFD